MSEFRVKRVHDEALPTDVVRVLVDRLWPRGISKQRAQLDEWAKDVTPSSGLRKDYHREVIDLAEFHARYRAELDESGAVERFLDEHAGDPVVTLLTAVTDEARDRSHVPVLLQALAEGQDS